MESHALYVIGSCFVHGAQSLRMCCTPRSRLYGTGRPDSQQCRPSWTIEVHQRARAHLEALGTPWGGFGKVLGGFGRLWEGFGKALGRH